MNKEERMFKSYLARKKRKDAKEIVAKIEKRKKANSKNLKKKYKKIKKDNSKKTLFDLKIRHFFILKSNNTCFSL